MISIFSQCTYMVSGYDNVEWNNLFSQCNVLVHKQFKISYYNIVYSQYSVCMYICVLRGVHWSWCDSVISAGYRVHSRQTRTRRVRECVWQSGTTVPIPSPALVHTYILLSRQPLSFYFCPPLSSNRLATSMTPFKLLFSIILYSRLVHTALQTLVYTPLSLTVTGVTYVILCCLLSVTLL